jgi:Ca-activated chloride channel family protein
MAAQSASGGTVLNPALTTAYKYADPDRTLNVILLSDGLTEQRERQTLLQLIQQRPRNVRVFCVGVGNEVNRPLLEQLAEDSGGLAAFPVAGGTFPAAGEAFRRKLMTPVATGLQMISAAAGVRLGAADTSQSLSRRSGSAIRPFPRSGTAEIQLKAEIKGQEYKQSAKLDFPAEDPNNPEIERMWAWRKMDRLLKDADRNGARDTATIDEIVRLGEGYSIVSEYTSFLVLENDGEYQRWKIDRRNALRIERDRKAQAAVRARMDELRTQATAALGPQEARPAAAPTAAAPVPAGANPGPLNSQPNAPATRAPVSNGRSLDIGLGTGPVGPLFLVFAAMLRKFRKTARG